MKLLKKFSDIIGPSGMEDEIRKAISREMKKYVDTVSTDKIGNLICHKKGKGPTAMLAAHMDEVGMMVEGVERDGKIRMSKIGGIDPLSVVGQKVWIVGKKKTITGVITFLELHEGLDVNDIPSIGKMYVDTGLDKKGLEKLGIRVGSYIIPKQDMEMIGKGKYYAGKALDNRTGCYVLVELAKKLNKIPQDIYYVFTVREEVGLHGAEVSVYHLEPDWGIAVDTTSAEDSIVPKKISLGSGPCITVKDAEIISDVTINDHLEKIAKRHKIPIQFKVDDFGTTDAAKMLLSKESIPTTAVNVPVRNIHSSIGIVHETDIENSINLLFHTLKSPPDIQQG